MGRARGWYEEVDRWQVVERESGFGELLDVQGDGG